MRRFVKYWVVPVVTFIFLLTATVIVLPVVVNVQKYLPAIEEKLTEVIGRPVSIGRELSVSFFPWLSISFSDMKVANPEGYSSEEFMKIESFEGRVRLWPLLKKEIEISRFIVGGLEVNLEKRADGKVNWDFSKAYQSGAARQTNENEWIFSKGFSIELFAVTDGKVTWRDNGQQTEHRIDDLMLLFNNFNLNDPVAMECQATIEGTPLVAEGMIGPLGGTPRFEKLPVDLAVTVMNSYRGWVKGSLNNLFKNVEYDLHLKMDDFSARDLFTLFDLDRSLLDPSPTNFQSVEVDVTAKGDKNKLSIEKGRVKVDDSHAEIFLVINDFKRPHFEFSLDVDSLNLDRYLGTSTSASRAETGSVLNKQRETDYSGWRKTNLTGLINLKKLQFSGGTVEDIKVHLLAADGLFTMDPASFSLYQGEGQALITVDFQRPVPQTSIDFTAQGVLLHPLLHDFFQKDFVSGSLAADMRLLFSGYQADAIKSSLYADGILTCREGAFVGIDMVDALGNIKENSGSSDQSDQETRTDFTEIKSVISIRNGVVSSKDTELKSPLADVRLSGTADIVKQQLQLMIEPEAVTVVALADKGTAEKDGKDISDNSIPFSFSGSFSEPKISIDARYLSLEGLSLPKELDLQSYIDEKMPSPVEEDVKNLVGTTLIDPAVVAHRFGLQPELIRKGRAKKQLKVGSGKVSISPLEEAESFR